MPKKKEKLEDKWAELLALKMEIQELEFTIKDLGDEKREISTRIRTLAQDLFKARATLLERID